MVLLAGQHPHFAPSWVQVLLPGRGIVLQPEGQPGPGLHQAGQLAQGPQKRQSEPEADGLVSILVSNPTLSGLMGDDHRILALGEPKGTSANLWAGVEGTSRRQPDWMVGKRGHPYGLFWGKRSAAV